MTVLLSAEGRQMREAGLAGVSRRKGPRTTRRDPQARPAPDLVERRFEAEAPDRLWVAESTYVPTAAGFLYLAVVLDVFSRRVVGWSVADHLRTELVLNALDMAVGQRRPGSVIHHSEVVSTRRWPSVNAAANGAWHRRWARSGIVTTTPWRRASSPLWSASCSTEPGSMIIAKHRARSSSSSKDGITRTVVTRDWAITHPWTSRSPTRTLHETQDINRPLKRINFRNEHRQIR